MRHPVSVEEKVTVTIWKLTTNIECHIIVDGIHIPVMINHLLMLLFHSGNNVPPIPQYTDDFENTLASCTLPGQPM